MIEPLTVSSQQFSFMYHHNSKPDCKKVNEENTSHDLFGDLIELLVDSLAVGFDRNDEDDEKRDDEIVAN